MLVASESPAQKAEPPDEQTNVPDVPLLLVQTEVSLRVPKTNDLSFHNIDNLLGDLSTDESSPGREDGSDGEGPHVDVDDDVDVDV